MKKSSKIKIGFLIFISLSFAVNNQKYMQNIQIEYLGFEKFGGSSRMNLLYLKIKNNTGDKMYLSNKNIYIKVFKNNKPLKEDENISRGQVVFNPSTANKVKLKMQEEQEKKTAFLKYTFAKKLFYKNFGNNKYKKDKVAIIKQIENTCIVILPNESVNYAKLFNNSLFDKKCKVDIRYVIDKRFTYFVDDNGKAIDINY